MKQARFLKKLKLVLHLVYSIISNTNNTIKISSIDVCYTRPYTCNIGDFKKIIQLNSKERKEMKQIKQMYRDGIWSLPNLYILGI